MERIDSRSMTPTRSRKRALQLDSVAGVDLDLLPRAMEHLPEAARLTRSVRHVRPGEDG